MVRSYIGATLIIVGISWLLLRLGLVERARRISGVMRQSAATVADRSLSDHEKERALRRQSLTLFGFFATLTLGLGLALGVPILLVWLLAQARLWSFDSVIAASLSWPFLLGGAGVFVAVMVRSGRRDAV